MRSDNNQLDIYRDDSRAADPAMAEKYRQAAEAAMMNPYETMKQREARRDHYLEEAKRYSPSE